MQCGSETYCFTGKQLRALAHLMRRVGLVLWQQALLFPQVCFGSLGFATQLLGINTRVGVLWQHAVAAGAAVSAGVLCRGGD